jgi:hypothetical protein
MFAICKVVISIVILTKKYFVHCRSNQKNSIPEPIKFLHKQTKLNVSVSIKITLKAGRERKKVLELF